MNLRAPLLLATFVIATSMGFAAPAAASDFHLELEPAALFETAETLTNVGAVAPLPVLEFLPLQSKNNLGEGPPQLSGVGLGLQVGSPTAVTIKFAGLQKDGIVLGVGVGFGYGGRFRRDVAASLSIHVDYLFHLATLIRNADLSLTFYAGPGLWATVFGGGYGFGGGYYYARGFNYFGLGVRVPLGLSMAFAAAPLEVYLELDPAIFVFPGIDFGVGASLGFRWHF
jgi:hypothetical protein